MLALKRDLSRASSTTRTSSEEPTVISYQESVLATTPVEIIDIETNDSLKTLLDKFKNTFSPTTKRRTSEYCSIDIEEKQQQQQPRREQRHSSISALSNRTHRRNRLRHHKSVSFAEDIEVNNSDLIVSTLTDGKIMTNNEEINTPNLEDDETNFQDYFHQVIRPRRMSIGNGKDLVYQDLSAEIVAYVLKHALRAIEKEDQELLLTKNQKDEQDDELIDLK